MTMVAAAPAAPLSSAARRVRRLPWRSPEDQPRWARPALLALTAACGVVYALGLRNQQVHNYYLPAVKSMSESWRAFFYGAFDPAASITLDKLPGAFQVQALSARVFGFSNWSVLAPQVIESVLTVLVMYCVVRRWLGPGAGLLAAGAFATMPIVAALSHAQISDTLLTLLLVLAAHAWQRAVMTGRLPWLLLSGGWVGLAFQTKMVQAWGVLPALALGYLVAAPVTLRRRVGHVALAGLVTLAVSAWWIVLVLATPASSRPYVDGSVNNSPLSMVFEYNLLSRYEAGADPGGLGVPGRGGSGWGYMLSDQVAGQVGWLYPLALVGVVAGVWWRGRAPRTDLLRVGFLMWGAWFTVHAVAFSAGRVAHSFYVVAVAPAVAALAAGGLVLGWRAYRRGGSRRWVLPTAVALTVAHAVYLSSRFPTFQPWIRPVVVTLGLVGVAVLVAVPLVRRAGRSSRSRRHRRLGAGLALAGGALSVASVLVAPAAWAVSTVDRQYSGSAIGPAAGPMTAGGPGGARFSPATSDAPTGIPGSGMQGRGMQGRGTQDGDAPGGADRPAGPGGRVGSAAPTEQSRQLIDVLSRRQPGTKYLVAVQGSTQAGALILAGASVLPIGGFSGQVPSTTADQLAELVASGQLRYVLGGDGAGRRGGGGAASTAITDWVTGNCAILTDEALQGSTVYDCAAS